MRIDYDETRIIENTMILLQKNFFPKTILDQKDLSTLSWKIYKKSIFNCTLNLQW